MRLRVLATGLATYPDLSMVCGPFELDEADMTAISALDRGERTGPNPDEFNYVPG